MRRRLLIISAIVVLFSCKKTGDEKKEHKFSFEFKGKMYNDPSNAGIILLTGGLDLLFIDRKDLFDGEIFFYANSSISSNCAYLVPAGEHYVAHLPGCILYDGGVPVDSVTTYYYRSGNFNYSKSNCVRKTEINPTTGARVEFDVCDVSGSFSLTLGNKINKTIAITNGSFSFYGVRL